MLSKRKQKKLESLRRRIGLLDGLGATNDVARVQRGGV
jgi:hypothetical protein